MTLTLSADNKQYLRFALWAVAAIALARLVLVWVFPQFSRFSGRDLYEYTDLKFYLNQGQTLASGGLQEAAASPKFVANPLFSLIISWLVGVFGSYRNLAFIGFLLAALREFLWCFLLARLLPTRKVLFAALLGCSPYLFVYSFNFTSDLLASLLVIGFFAPPVLQRELELRKGLLLYGCCGVVLAVASLIRASLLPLVVAYGFLWFFRLRRGWAEASRRARIFSGLASGVSVVITALSVAFAAKYYLAFQTVSATYGVLARGDIERFLLHTLGGGSASIALSYLATPVVHLLSFFTFRESVYILGFTNTADYVVLAVLLVTLLPAVVWMVRHPASLTSVATLLLFAPCAFGVSQARFSFLLHPALLLISVAVISGQTSALASLDVREFVKPCTTQQDRHCASAR